MLSISYIKRNLVLFSLLIFVTSYILLNIIKPNFLYNENSTIRDFGIGFRKKTVLPLWLISIVLAILSYFSVLYYVTYNRIKF